MKTFDAANRWFRRLNDYSLQDLDYWNIDLYTIASWSTSRETQGLTLKEALSQVYTCEATDPRDKIYVILFIVNDGQHEDLRPDYALPLNQVYTRLAKHLIVRDADLDILGYSSCELKDQTEYYHVSSSDWFRTFLLGQRTGLRGGK